jgi:hypothetical protein
MFVQEGLNGTLRRLFDPAALLSKSSGPRDAAAPPILDARISGDGKLVGFVWDRELYVVSTDCASSPVQLTSGASGTELTNGLADYIAQEEMERYEGYWISADSSMCAFEQVSSPSCIPHAVLPRLHAARCARFTPLRSRSPSLRVVREGGMCLSGDGAAGSSEG